MVSEKSRTNLDDQPEVVENPSLRKNLKRLAAFFVVAALGTFPSNLKPKKIQEITKSYQN